jgi:hypothetical protein
MVQEDLCSDDEEEEVPMPREEMQIEEQGDERLEEVVEEEAEEQWQQITTLSTYPLLL